MTITYTEEKKFTQADVERLFLSVGWLSGKYPSRLFKALQGSSSVLTAWDGARLVGLVRALDDGELTAFLHYVLVDPKYQRRGIGDALIERVKVKYRRYLYIELMPEERKNATFYERHGFRVMPDGGAMQLCNFSDQR